MISVIIPLYNKESSIGATIQTVLNQSFQDFEIIVVNDGSSDNGPDVVRSLDDSRIRLIDQKNGGVSSARNRGIREAKGEYIAFLDADDEWEMEYLMTLDKMIRKYPECSVYATNYRFKNAKGVFSKTIINNIEFKGLCGIINNYFQIASTSHPPLWTSAVMVKKEAIEKIGGFPLGIKSGEDLLTWARLATRYKIAYCKEPMAVFVFDETNFNEDQSNRDVSLEDEVGHELKILLKTHNMIPYLKEYIGLWYKMRSRIYLTKHCRLKALKESIKSMKYDFNLKILVFFAMSFLPYSFNNFLFRKLG